MLTHQFHCPGNYSLIDPLIRKFLPLFYPLIWKLTRMKSDVYYHTAKWLNMNQSSKTPEWQWEIVNWGLKRVTHNCINNYLMKIKSKGILKRRKALKNGSFRLFASQWLIKYYWTLGLKTTLVMLKYIAETRCRFLCRLSKDNISFYLIILTKKNH